MSQETTTFPNTDQTTKASSSSDEQSSQTESQDPPSPSEKKKGVVHVKKLASGVATIFMGEESETALSLTRERLQSLKNALEELHANPPKGLVITGSSERMFTVGADINLIKDITDPVAGESAAREGQLIFDLIESLPCTTVAAISGPAVGGGCEMALACTHRIITSHPSSQIGLPEVSLGILPGFGGTQRLPRVVGLPKALEIILAGKKLRPKQALSAKLVDKIVSPDGLLDLAERVASGVTSIPKGKPSFMDWLLTYVGPLRNFVAKKATASLEKKTKGHYPAPPAALGSVLHGLRKGLDSGYAFEAQELGRLIVTPESKSLVHLYFLTEFSRAIGKPAREDVQSLQTVVIGAGVMGAGIAGLLAKKEYPVILKDTAQAALDKGLSHIRKVLGKLRYLSDSERSFIEDRISTTTEDTPAVAQADVAIEAIVEQMHIKKEVFVGLANRMSENALLLTNTSSLSVSELAGAVHNPERVAGMHFFNPVEKMPLLEIVQGTHTSPRTICLVAALAEKLGKFPIVVRDVPGFLVNRILTPYLNEAAFLVADGYSPESVDKAALSFGMPMGPIRLLDEVGLDVATHVAQVMSDGYGQRMQAPQFAKVLAENGLLGKKSGKGFYIHNEEGETPNDEVRSLLQIEATPVINPDFRHIQDRLMMALLNEAVRCLDEGVAGTPGEDAAKQIDLGTVMGMGFPPFHGGLIRYAESLGAEAIATKLKSLEERYGSRFSPWQGIETRAAEKLSLYKEVKLREQAIGSE